MKVGTWELKNDEMGDLQMVRMMWKRGLQSRIYPYPNLQWVLPPPGESVVQNNLALHVRVQYINSLSVQKT